MEDKDKDNSIINKINSLSTINDSKTVLIFRKNINIEKNKIKNENDNENKEKENILIYYDKKLIYSKSLTENKFNKNSKGMEKKISEYVNIIQKIESKNSLNEIGIKIRKSEGK